jgi:hypothetical protein
LLVRSGKRRISKSDIQSFGKLIGNNNSQGKRRRFILTFKRFTIIYEEVKSGSAHYY